MNKLIDLIDKKFESLLDEFEPTHKFHSDITNLKLDFLSLVIKRRYSILDHLQHESSRDGKMILLGRSEWTVKLLIKKLISKFGATKRVVFSAVATAVYFYSFGNQKNPHCT